MNLQVVFVAVIVSVIAPLVLGMVTARQQRATNREDWARQDVLAQRVKADAAELAALTEASRKQVTQRLDSIDTRVGQVHVLVNGRLTAALQAALRDAKVIERFASVGTEPVDLSQATPAALKAQLEAEVAKWGKVIKAAGIKAQ